MQGGAVRWLGALAFYRRKIRPFAAATPTGSGSGDDDVRVSQVFGFHELFGAFDKKAGQPSPCGWNLALA